MLRSRQRLGLDIGPRPHGVWVGHAVSQPSLELGSLPLRQRRCFYVANHAVPNRFRDLKPLLEQLEHDLAEAREEAFEDACEESEGSEEGDDE